MSPPTPPLAPKLVAQPLAPKLTAPLAPKHPAENSRPLDSLVYALFQIYGEHQRPDLAVRTYTRLLDAIPGRA